MTTPVPRRESVTCWHGAFYSAEANFDLEDVRRHPDAVKVWLDRVGRVSEAQEFHVETVTHARTVTVWCVASPLNLSNQASALRSVWRRPEGQLLMSEIERRAEAWREVARIATGIADDGSLDIDWRDPVTPDEAAAALRRFAREQGQS